MPRSPAQQSMYDKRRAWLRDAACTSDPTRCLPWPWLLTPNGYPTMHLEGRQRSLTHVVLEMTGRPRPPAPDNFALHSCAQRSCLSPYHLRWGSHLANMADRQEHGHTRGAVGEAHGHAKLTAADVAALRKDAARYGPCELARRYGVAEATVRDALARRTWAHL